MTALIIDTISIQPYIFGSNKLKENIGGSYIIEELVYKKMIHEVLSTLSLSTSIDIEEWKTNPMKYTLKEEPEASVEIGYIGGGNAFLIFRKTDDAKAFVKTYSKLLLAYFPGLKTAYGILEGFKYQEGDDYKKFRRDLNKDLIQNRNFSATQVLPFKHGIAEDCPWTNEAQEVRDSQSGSIISMMAKSRLRFVEDAKICLTKKFDNQIKGEYTFTDDLEKFGQPDDKGYIAIVHADGNAMGQRFINCNSLAETRKLSSGVADYAVNVMKKLVGHLINSFEGEEPAIDWELKKDEERKRILPIRPLILGGDDITFVCEGRLGVHLAEKLLEYMSQTPINEDTIHACAGVAIVHTKYPFYKAYQLAEELTKRAKDASRGVGGGSWLEYMISTGGFSGPLKEIIADQFTVAGKGNLKFGPYRIDGIGSTIKEFHQGMSIFSNKWPRNKIKDLRDALRKDDAYRSYFLTEMKARGLSLPDGSESLWQGDKTPYYDMIELLDFYPENLLV
ncbi:MAG: hypothetical protein IPI11_15880 [Haliscomenobacter sp.]|nr:hypothetical protein [Haliscomenobacter sp.]